METVLQDMRYSVRTLIKNRSYTIVALIALALGIGANSAIFSIVYGVLLQPLPYRNADRLMVAGMSIPDYRDIKESNTVFDDSAVWASNLYNVRGDRETEQTLGAVVSPSFFRLLGDPLLGRAFREEEERTPLVILGFNYWKSRFAGDPGAIGKEINLSGRSHTVVGVMPPEFQFPSADYNLWVTFGSALSSVPQQTENRSLRIFRVLAHLKPNAAPSQAQAEIDSISARLQKEHPNTNDGVRFVFVPLYERIVGDVRPALLMLMGAVGFVLLIACANAANLTLARTASREREIAVRAALGASRGRIARLLLTESLLLSFLGGMLGLLAAVWIIDAAPKLVPNDIPRLDSIGLNIPVLVFTLLISVLTGILFGILPAFKASRRDLQETLKEGGKSISGTLLGRRMRNVLAAAEIALSIVVLVGAGLLVRSFIGLMKTDPGFIADDLLLLNVQLLKYEEPQKRAAVALEVIEAVRRIPGVQAAGGGTGLPPLTPQRATGFAAEGAPAEGGARSAYFMAVTPDYFKALGAKLLEGRAFDDRDNEASQKVVIINRSLAGRLFPNEEPIGKRLKLINSEQSDEWRNIVGVVGDIKYSGLDNAAEAAVYTPFSQTPFLWVYVMTRGSEPLNLASAVRNAVSSVDPDLFAANIQTMNQSMSQSVAQPQFNMSLAGAFAVLALILAMVGLYSVMSYTVAERTREIGIRMALGAQSADVMRMVIGQGMAVTLIGVAIGLGGAFAATRLMSSLLYGVGPTDPATFAIISALTIVVSAAAAYIPARRATRVDPIVALRYE